MRISWELRGDSIARLTAIRKLSEASKVQYLNGLSQFLRHIGKDPDPFLSEDRPLLGLRQHNLALSRKAPHRDLIIVMHDPNLSLLAV